MGQIAQIAKANRLTPAQSTAIQFFDDTGNEIIVTSNDVAQFICPKATQKEILFFMELCRAQRLNPFLNEAYLVKYGQEAQMITAEVVFERRANAHPDFKGIKSGVVYMNAGGEVCKREGSAVYSEANETLLGGWANVEREGRSDTYAEISLREYNKNQSTWKTMPGTMITKCARAAALRKAFPADFEGMYVQDELSSVPSVTEVAATVSDDEPSELKSKIAKIADIRNVPTSSVYEALANNKHLTDTGYSGGDMTGVQEQIALSIVDGWIQQASEPMEAIDADTGEIIESE